MYVVISHVFNGWADINLCGDMADILKTKRSSLNVFERFDTIEERNESQTTFVAYIIDKNKVIAFGCATHFLTNQNYYQDDDEECDCVKCNTHHDDSPPCEEKEEKDADEICLMSNQSTRRLWVEGMASLKKGCGTLILQELERWLFEQDSIYKLGCPINLMAVTESIGFYDKNGYIECGTSPYWGGSDCTRMVKFKNEGAKIAQTLTSEVLTCWDNMETYDEDRFSNLLVQIIAQDRIIFVNKYMKLPVNVNRDLAEYVLDHKLDDIYGSLITKERKELLIENLEEHCGEWVAKNKAKRAAKKMWEDKFEVQCVSDEQRKFMTDKIKSFISRIEEIDSYDEKLKVCIDLFDYMAEEDYKMCTHARFKQTVRSKCEEVLHKTQFKTGIKPKTREFVFALTCNMNYLPNI